jgi:hypothetical protein
LIKVKELGFVLQFPGWSHGQLVPRAHHC